ncbi:MAG: hypothetical protein ACLVEJ_23545 [Parabacteroides sp.]
MIGRTLIKAESPLVIAVVERKKRNRSFRRLHGAGISSRKCQRLVESGFICGELSRYGEIKRLVNHGDTATVRSDTSPPGLYSVARSQIIDRSRKHREEEMPYLSANEEDGTFLKELAELMPDEDQSPEMDCIQVLPSGEELEHVLGVTGTSDGPSAN